MEQELEELLNRIYKIVDDPDCHSLNLHWSDLSLLQDAIEKLRDQENTISNYRNTISQIMRLIEK